MRYLPTNVWHTRTHDTSRANGYQVAWHIQFTLNFPAQLYPWNIQQAPINSNSFQQLNETASKGNLLLFPDTILNNDAYQFIIYAFNRVIMQIYARFEVLITLSENNTFMNE